MLDTGAIRHIICQKAYFQSFLTCKETVNWGSASSIKIKGSGRVLIRFLDSSHTLSLEDCLFMPNIGLNLILTSKLKSNSLVTPNKALMFSNEGNLLTIGQQVKGLYYLPVQVQNQALVLQESRKRKVSFEPFEQTSEQLSKRAKIDLESLEDIQGILERADQALEKAKRLKEALIKANKAVQQAMPKKKTKEVKEVKRAKRATLSL